MNIKELKNLTKEYKYKIETHAHTNPVSPCGMISAVDTIKRYKNVGFDAIVITNHFIDYLAKSDAKTTKDFYLKDFYDAKNAGEKYGVKVILGMEIRFPENQNDYLLYGINENDVETLYDYLFTDYKTFYNEFKKNQHLILQAHPFRNNMVLQDPKLLDGIETFNVHFNHNSRIALATKYATEYPEFITTCGTDFHDPDCEGFGGILSKTLPTNPQEFVSLLKSRDYLFNVVGKIVIP